MMAILAQVYAFEIIIRHRIQTERERPLKFIDISIDLNKG